MLLAKGVPIPEDVATGLYYGIKSETQDLARDATETDVEVYRELEKLMDRRCLARIETGRVPREYFTDVLTALSTATIRGRVLTADLGLLRVPDMVPEMADFLLRMEGIRWSCVMGEYQGALWVYGSSPAVQDLIRKLRAEGITFVYAKKRDGWYLK